MVSRNLKNIKKYFIEAQIYELTVTDTTPNSVSTWTWLCVAYHLTWKLNVTNIIFIFETSPNTKPKDNKVGGTWHIMSPRLKKWGRHGGHVLHQIAPMMDKRVNTRPKKVTIGRQEILWLCLHVKGIYFSTSAYILKSKTIDFRTEKCCCPSRWTKAATSENFGVAEVTFSNDYDVIDVQSTMMRPFCYDQLTN